jgi:hypothetical protein
MKEHVGQVRRTGPGVVLLRRGSGVTGRTDSGARWEGGEQSVTAPMWMGERVLIDGPALR